MQSDCDCPPVGNYTHGLYVAHQCSLPMGFSRQAYWSGLPCPSPGESSQPRDQTQVSHFAGRFFALWATREAHTNPYTASRFYSTSINQKLVFLACRSFYLMWRMGATRREAGCSQRLLAQETKVTQLQGLSCLPQGGFPAIASELGIS